MHTIWMYNRIPVRIKVPMDDVELRSNFLVAVASSSEMLPEGSELVSGHFSRIIAAEDARGFAVDDGLEHRQWVRGSPGHIAIRVEGLPVQREAKS